MNSPMRLSSGQLPVNTNSMRIETAKPKRMTTSDKILVQQQATPSTTQSWCSHGSSREDITTTTPLRASTRTETKMKRVKHAKTTSTYANKIHTQNLTRWRIIFILCGIYFSLHGQGAML